MSHFAHAVLAPFDKDAVGAKVPDAYTFPTATATVKRRFSVTSNDDGVVCFTVGPSPIYSVSTPTTLFNQGSNQQSTIFGPIGPATGGWVNGPLATTSLLPATGTNQMFGSIAAADMASNSQTYRVVGYGWRYRSIMASTDSKGNVYLCATPTAAKAALPYNVALSQGSEGDGNLQREYLQLPSTAAGEYNPAIADLPSGKRFTYREIALTGLEFVGQAINPSAHEFRDSNNSTQLLGSASSGQAQISDFVIGSNTALRADIPGFGGETSFYRNDGWTQASCMMTGLPVNTGTGELEIIYHLEYTERISYLALNVFNHGAPSPTAPAHHAQVIAKAREQPHFSVIDTIANEVVKEGTRYVESQGGVIPTLFNLAKTFL